MLRNLLMIGVGLLLIAQPHRLPSEEPTRNAVEAAPIVGMTEWDHRNLERNLRWMLHREQLPNSAKPRVAVFADAGVWHVGARSIVDALEGEGIPCRVISRSQLKLEILQQFEALILPGGWAPFQRDAAGKEGHAAFKSYVEQGGRCLAICAGAYLISRQTRYDNVIYPYPVGLFDGTAEGPIAGLAVFPEPGSVTVAVTAAGKRRGMTSIEGHSAYYSGGPRFVGGSGVEVLAKYPDNSAAAIARTVGKGEIILLGMHFERAALNAGGDEAPVPAIAGKFYRNLLFSKQPERR